METSSPLEKLTFEAPPLADLTQVWAGFFHRHQWRIYTLALVINDILTTAGAFWLAYLFRFHLHLPFFEHDAFFSSDYYIQVICAMVPLWLIIFTEMGLYNRQKLLGGVQEYSLLFNSTIIGVAIMISAGFLLPSFVLSRGWLIASWPISFIATAIGRFSLRRWVYFLRGKGFYLTPALIVGANDEGKSLAQQLVQWQTSGLHLVGFIDKKIASGTPVLGYLTVLGSLKELHEVVLDHQIEEIILARSAFSTHDSVMEIFQRYGVSEKVNVRLSSGLYEIITTGLTVKEFAYVPFVCINKVRLTGIERLLKMLLDYSLTIPGLLLIAPLFLLLAVAVRIDSPGPVIYQRRVMGVNGRQFDAFKFRTMYLNGDDMLAEKYPELLDELKQNHKLKNDPRITRVGNLLRKTSLDELPQLLNVLKGEMSLVGPRMITAGEVEKYTRWDINLLTIPPGITGLWQVSGRSDVSYEERVRLDMYYIRNWSIWLDLQLIFRTIPAVLSRRGAY